MTISSHEEHVVKETLEPILLSCILLLQLHQSDLKLSVCQLLHLLLILLRLVSVALLGGFWKTLIGCRIKDRLHLLRKYYCHITYTSVLYPTQRSRIKLSHPLTQDWFHVFINPFVFNYLLVSTSSAILLCSTIVLLLKRNDFSPSMPLPLPSCINVLIQICIRILSQACSSLNQLTPHSILLWQSFIQLLVGTFDCVIATALWIVRTL